MLCVRVYFTFDCVSKLFGKCCAAVDVAAINNVRRAAESVTGNIAACHQRSKVHKRSERQRSGPKRIARVVLCFAYVRISIDMYYVCTYLTFEHILYITM